MNLLNTLLVNLFKIKIFVNISIGEDLKVIISKLKWLNKHPLIKDFITADGDLLNNAIFQKLLS